MTEYQIVCITHDKNEVITYVGFDGQYESVSTVVTWINSGKHNFFTLKNGNRAEVYARKNKQSGRWFLTTEPDGVLENNLDFLIQC